MWSGRLGPVVTATPASPTDSKIIVEGGPDAERAVAQAAPPVTAREPAETGTVAPQPTPPAPEAGLLADLLPLLLTVVLSALAGFIGGWAAFRSQKIEPHLEKLDRDFESHWRSTEKQLADIREQVQRAASGNPAAARPAGQAPRRDEQSDYWTEPRPQPAPEPRGEAPPPQPRRAPPDLGSIAARFGQLTRGNISRTAFAEFFASLGDSTAVESADGGRSLQQAQGDGFLTAVDVGGHILVFPSYRFVSNWDTQFAFMASVPESVTELFELARGDGEIAMARPALFESNAGGAPRRIDRGEIRGFQG
jgi:hypothetical protein